MTATFLSIRSISQPVLVLALTLGISDSAVSDAIMAPVPCLPAPPFAGGFAAVPGSAPRLVDPPTPVVSLRVRVPATAAAGQEVEYRILVQNHSAAAAHHVLVRNPVPAQARFVRASPEPTTNRDGELSWQLGTLEAAVAREISLFLSPTGTGDIQNCARVQFEHGQCVTTRLARPSLALQKFGPAQAALHQSVPFQLLVTNNGPVEVSGIVMTDALPDGLAHASGRRNLIWDIGTLAPGQSRTVDYQVTATLAGWHRNKAVAATPFGLRAESESHIHVP